MGRTQLSYRSWVLNIPEAGHGGLVQPSEEPVELRLGLMGRFGGRNDYMGGE